MRCCIFWNTLIQFLFKILQFCHTHNLRWILYCSGGFFSARNRLQSANPQLNVKKIFKKRVNKLLWLNVLYFYPLENSWRVKCCLNGFHLVITTLHSRIKLEKLYNKYYKLKMNVSFLLFFFHSKGSFIRNS